MAMDATASCPFVKAGDGARDNDYGRRNDGKSSCCDSCMVLHGFTNPPVLGLVVLEQERNVGGGFLAILLVSVLQVPVLSEWSTPGGAKSNDTT